MLRPGLRHASVSANDVREGELLEMENGLWRVVKREFSRAAQGRAFVQMELRHLTENTKRDIRFRSEDMVDTAQLDSPARYTVLYSTADSVTVMHQGTFEQTELPVEVLGDRAKYLHDGLVLTIEAYQGTPAIVNLPNRITGRVVELDPSGGDAATVVPVNPESDAAATPVDAGGSSFKVRVPKFVKVGDRVVVETETGKYLSREQ